MGVQHPDHDARWQVAQLLGGLGMPSAIELLRSLLDDSHEYVRRGALLALRSHDPQTAEAVSLVWLESPHEYARMVAIDTLAEVGSAALLPSLQNLKNDPSDVVRSRVEKIERELTG